MAEGVQVPVGEPIIEHGIEESNEKDKENAVDINGNQVSESRKSAEKPSGRRTRQFRKQYDQV